MQLIVREANEGDARAISLIGVKSWQAAYQNIIPNEYLNSLSAEKREIHLSKSLAIPTIRFAVSEMEGLPVGMICFYPLQDEKSPSVEWELEALYVLPHYWNKGIGRSLIQYAFQYMIINNASACNLWVSADNQRARKFYENMGMVFSEEEKIITIGGKNLIEVRYKINF
jgi:GNAT superfamily N-acetyltransferase